MPDSEEEKKYTDFISGLSKKDFYHLLLDETLSCDVKAVKSPILSPLQNVADFLY